MKRKYNHPEMTDFNIISFEENNVLVEFPSLKDKTKKDIEQIATDFLATVTVQTVGGSFIEGQRIDLFDRDAAKQARKRAKKREREANLKYGIEDPSDEKSQSVDDMRKKKERKQEDSKKKEEKR